MKHGLKENVLKGMNNVFAKYSQIDKVLLFGSRAKGTHKNGSDIDLALVGESLTLQDLQNISLDLDELYLPYSFDLLVFKDIENPELLSHIERVSVLVYEAF
jgi:predicted nucleotidyltransferase